MIIKSLEQLNLLASRIGEKISHTDCIFLFGEIGVGKTTLTRNIINYLQKKQDIQQTEVLSPTFNLLYEYAFKNLKLMHYDLYRIKDTKELDQLGIFNEDVNSVKIIEWPELIKKNVLDKLELHLSYSSKENERNLILKKYGKWKNFSIDEL